MAGLEGYGGPGPGAMSAPQRPRLKSEGAPRKERLHSHMERSGKVTRVCAHRPGHVKPIRRTDGENRPDGKQRPFFAPGGDRPQGRRWQGAKTGRNREIILGYYAGTSGRPCCQKAGGYCCKALILLGLYGWGGRIRTPDILIQSQTCYHCTTPQRSVGSAVSTRRGGQSSQRWPFAGKNAFPFCGAAAARPGKGGSTAPP